MNETIEAKDKPAEDPDSADKQVGRVNAYLSVVALIISLIAGGYGLVDTFYFKREEATQADTKAVREGVKRLTEINMTVLATAMQNREASTEISKISNPEKIAILAFVDSVVSRHSDERKFLDAGTYFLLASEHLNFANVNLALDYTEKSLASAGANKALSAEALRLKGRTLFVPSEKQDRGLARQTLGQARDVVRNFSSPGSGPIEINILHDWMISEANFGDCAKANELAVEANEVAAKNGIPFEVMQQMVERYKSYSDKTRACLH